MAGWKVEQGIKNVNNTMEELSCCIVLAHVERMRGQVCSYLCNILLHEQTTEKRKGSKGPTLASTYLSLIQTL